MPKDEFDFDDPMELNGMALLSDDDTTDAMTECFIEEFMRLGWNHKQILALFRNPHYIGMNMVMQNHGEDYVKNFITEVFARWGKQIIWSSSAPIPLTPALSPRERQNVIQPAKQLQVALENPARASLFPPHKPLGQPFVAYATKGWRNGSWVQCANLSGNSLPEGEDQGEKEACVNSSASPTHEQRIELNSTASDPMGAAIPKLDL